MLVWIFLKWSLFQLLRAFFVSLILLHRINVGFPWNWWFQASWMITMLNGSHVKNSSNLKGDTFFLSFIVLSKRGLWYEAEEFICWMVPSGKSMRHFTFAIPRSNRSLINDLPFRLFVHVKVGPEKLTSISPWESIRFCRPPIEEDATGLPQICPIGLIGRWNPQCRAKDPEKNSVSSPSGSRNLLCSAIKLEHKQKLLTREYLEGQSKPK